MISAAQAPGVTVELDLYPLHSQALHRRARSAPPRRTRSPAATPTKIQQFAAWIGERRATFPTVHQFIVMNECNQPLFVNPQWGTTGLNQSAAICGRALAAAYDALKAVSPSNFVWGVGLSPRGNDAPNAASNSSTSPVRFLGYLGAWFKCVRGEDAPHGAADGRPRLPPVPGAAVAPVREGLRERRATRASRTCRGSTRRSTTASTARRSGRSASRTGGGLPVSLNEMGIQTDASGQPGYTGTEVSANAAGGMVGQYATEAYQATYYKQMLAAPRLRPERARDQPLPPGRRAEPRRLAERPLLGRRDRAGGEAVGRRRRRLARRRPGGDVPGEDGAVAARAARRCRRARRSSTAALDRRTRVR